VGPYTVFYYLSSDFHVIEMDFKMTQQNTMPNVIWAIERGYFDDFYSDSMGRVWHATERDCQEEDEVEGSAKYIRADLHTDLLKQARDALVSLDYLYDHMRPDAMELYEKSIDAIDNILK
jgi:hypothetical protein